MFPTSDGIVVSDISTNDEVQSTNTNTTTTTSCAQLWVAVSTHMEFAGAHPIPRPPVTLPPPPPPPAIMIMPLEEDDEHDHNKQQDSFGMITTAMGTFRQSMSILMDIFIHAVLAAIVTSAIVIPMIRMCLFDVLVARNRKDYSVSNTTTNATKYLTFDDLSLHEQIQFKISYYVVGQVAVMLHMAVLSVSLFQHLPTFDNVRVRIVILVFLVADVTMTFIAQYYVPALLSFLSILFALLCFITCIVLLARGYFHHPRGGRSARRVLQLGAVTIVAFIYGFFVIAYESFRKSEWFRWASPVVLPFTAFMVRYWGQKSPLPETSVSKLNSTVTIVSSVITRTIQCVYLSGNNTDFSFFIILEVFYDVIGVIIRVTLYHRQRILERILSGDVCRNKSFLSPVSSPTSLEAQQSARSRLVSSQCVVHTCIVETISFITMFSTKVSLLDSVDATTWSCMFVGCLLLQFLCYHVTHLLVRKVEAVPLKDLDVPTWPINKLVGYHLFYTSGVLFTTSAFSGVILSMWFPEDFHEI